MSGYILEYIQALDLKHQQQKLKLIETYPHTLLFNRMVDAIRFEQQYREYFDCKFAHNIVGFTDINDLLAAKLLI